MKDIKGYEGLYGITSCGRVWSYRRQKFLTPGVNDKGYLIVCLRKDGQNKMYKIHRLVAEAYLPNPENLSDVDHIDNDKTHNYVNNLQWLSHKDNVRKSCNKPILQYSLDGEFIREWPSATDAAKEFKGHICDCAKGRRKTAANYIWKYKN